METYNGFAVGKKYNYRESSVVCYFCGLTIQGNPIFEIVPEEDGCGISFNSDQFSSKWVSKGSNKYWSYRGLEQEFDPNPIEDKEEKEMTIEEIQEECKKRFPIGCTFRNTVGQEHVLVQDKTVYNIPFKRNIVVASESQGCLYCEGKWAELVSLPEKQELTSLPEKWCIKPNQDTWKEIFKWADFSWTWHTGNKYVSYKKTHNKYKTFNFEEYTEITFEQFKKWVLKKEQEEYVPSLS